MWIDPIKEQALSRLNFKIDRVTSCCQNHHLMLLGCFFIRLSDEPYYNGLAKRSRINNYLNGYFLRKMSRLPSLRKERLSKNQEDFLKRKELDSLKIAVKSAPITSIERLSSKASIKAISSRSNDSSTIEDIYK